MDNNFKASTAFGTADILLPAENTDMSKWAVVACDQFTSQPEYWKDAARIAEGAPSALDLILPEAYLESPDSEQMIFYRFFDIFSGVLDINQKEYGKIHLRRHFQRV